MNQCVGLHVPVGIFQGDGAATHTVRGDNHLNRLGGELVQLLLQLFEDFGASDKAFGARQQIVTAGLGARFRRLDDALCRGDLAGGAFHHHQLRMVKGLQATQQGGKGLFAFLVERGALFGIGWFWIIGFGRKGLMRPFRIIGGTFGPLDVLFNGGSCRFLGRFLPGSGF